MRRSIMVCLLALLGGTQVCPAMAADATDAATTTEAAATVQAQQADPCIGVEVNGQRSQSFGCLTQKLQPTPSAQADNPENKVPGSEEIAHRPSNQVGLFNYSSLSHRMGNQLGVSVFPQRAPTAPAVPQVPLQISAPHINH